MSKRAEEAAVAFHNQALLKAKEYSELHGRSILEEVSYGRGLKSGFIQGYEQAEKDLALSWEDIRRIVLIYEMVLADKDWNKKPIKDGYEEVLRRFNKTRK